MILTFILLTLLDNYELIQSHLYLISTRLNRHNEYEPYSHYSYI